METIDHKINRLIRYHERMVGSRDPLRIAKFAGIGVAILPLGEQAGLYRLIKRKKWIFINEDLIDTDLFYVVAAHELGHAFLHRTKECSFIKGHTLLLTSGIEKEANMFAAKLLELDLNDVMMSEQLKKAGQGGNQTRQLQKRDISIHNR